MVPHTTIIDGASSSGSSVAHVESGDEYKEIVIKPKPGTIVFFLNDNNFQISILTVPTKFMIYFANGLLGQLNYQPLLIR